jgi:hypothetical protein
MSREARLLLVAACLSCLGATFAASAASTEPEIFSPGVISGPAGEACPAFTPDGNTVYFDVGSMILVSHRTQGLWSKPQIAPFSGTWGDHDPTIAPDGSYIVYVSNRPVDNSDRALSATSHGQVYPNAGGNLWRVDRMGSGWSTPMHLPAAVNDSDRTYAPSIAADGSLYYIHPDAGGTFHVYRSAYQNGNYQTAEQLVLGDPTAQVHDPAIAPDQSFIVFNWNDAKKPGMGGLYIAFREGNHWSQPTDLGVVVNGKDGRWNQWGAHLSPDHRTLYYTSDRTTPTSYPRTPEQAQQQLARMQQWDNGGDNIWSVSLAPWLDTHRVTGS